MAQIDFNERQLTIKLVYYGPPLSGKTTNLRHIHSRVDTSGRGRLMTLDTRDDRTIFFDLLPIFFKTSNLSFRVKVYTVPGQPMHAATRRIVLQGADGIAFVADSRRDHADPNRIAYENLLQNMERLGLPRPRVPIVVQYNKRDLPDIVPEDELRPFEGDGPVYPATAIEGAGVVDTFFGLLEATWDAIDRTTRIEKNFQIDRASFLEALQTHMNIR